MTRQYRSSIQHRIQSSAPEHLLLLTIFGGSRTRRQVQAELDRRATLRPDDLNSMPRAVQLQPAA
jgi:hypothetical protein